MQLNIECTTKLLTLHDMHLHKDSVLSVSGIFPERVRLYTLTARVAAHAASPAFSAMDQRREESTLS